VSETVGEEDQGGVEMEIMIKGFEWFHTLPAIVISMVSFMSWIVLGHCDSMGGPVVKAARKALDSSDVTPVLKWIRAEEEPQIREAFEKVLAVRTKGPEVQEMADIYFFETLVRLHRAGEGAPYSGLKPAGNLDPVIDLSDKALEKGDEKELIKHLTELVTDGIRRRFRRAADSKKRVEETVETGREFVEAYVDYIHFVERLYMDAKGHGSHH
jgi:hypothetical protein